MLQGRAQRCNHKSQDRFSRRHFVLPCAVGTSDARWRIGRYIFTSYDLAIFGLLHCMDCSDLGAQSAAAAGLQDAVKAARH